MGRQLRWYQKHWCYVRLCLGLQARIRLQLRCRLPWPRLLAQRMPIRRRSSWRSRTFQGPSLQWKRYMQLWNRNLHLLHGILWKQVPYADGTGISAATRLFKLSDECNLMDTRTDTVTCK